MQRKSFIKTHTTIYNVYPNTCISKNYKSVNGPFASSGLEVTGSIPSEAGPMCRRLLCVALYFGIASNRDCSLTQSSERSGLRNGGGHSRVPLPHRLAHSASISAAVKKTMNQCTAYGHNTSINAPEK